MNKKTIIIVACILVGIILITIKKDEKDIIFDYVLDNKSDILESIQEIQKLSTNIQNDVNTEKIVRIGNSEFNDYVDDVKGLYVEIENHKNGDRRIEINNKAISKILTGEPVEGIGINDEIIIFDCGGKGIVPSSQYYCFFYSPSDKPIAVFDRQILCEAEQMTKSGNGYEYTDKDFNVFYTERITDNLFYCIASF